MPYIIKTTGDRGLDAELDFLRKTSEKPSKAAISYISAQIAQQIINNNNTINNNPLNQTINHIVNNAITNFIEELITNNYTSEIWNNTLIQSFYQTITNIVNQSIYNQNIYITNSGKATCIIEFACGDWTPTATGVDTVQKIAPYIGNTGGIGQSVVWNFRRLTFRMRIAGSTASSINVQKSTVTGTFTGSDIMSSDLSIASGDYEGEATTFSVDSVNSGEKLSMAIRGIGTGSTGWVAMLMLEES
jgi:hypothetical protein